MDYSATELDGKPTVTHDDTTATLEKFNVDLYNQIRYPSYSQFRANLSEESENMKQSTSL